MNPRSPLVVRSQTRPTAGWWIAQPRWATAPAVRELITNLDLVGHPLISDIGLHNQLEASVPGDLFATQAVGIGKALDEEAGLHQKETKKAKKARKAKLRDAKPD